VTTPKYMNFYLDFGSFQLVNSTKALGVTMYKGEVAEWLIKLIPESFETNQVFSMANDDHLTDIKSHKDYYSSLLISELDRAPSNYNCELISIIGTVQDHYINYSKREGSWVLFDDHVCKKLGNYSKVIKHMIQGQILPYVIMYKTKLIKSMFKVDSVPKEAHFNKMSNNVIMEDPCESRQTEESKILSSKSQSRAGGHLSESYRNSLTMKKLHKGESSLTNDPTSKNARIDDNLISTKRSQRQVEVTKIKRTFIQKLLGLCGGGPQINA
jgi:hypothetical protein